MGFFLGFISGEVTAKFWRRLSQKIEHKAFSSTVHVPPVRVFFPPMDDVYPVFCSLVRHERKKIQCAAYRLTNKNFAEELCKAHDRGVEVEIVIDCEDLGLRYSCSRALHNIGISVYVYPDVAYTSSRKEGLMHNKFMVFHQNKDQIPVVWTGSFNFSKAAHQKNQENVVLIYGKEVHKEYAHYFNHLKQTTTRL